MNTDGLSLMESLFGTIRLSECQFDRALKHSIGLRLPLREAASAHDRIEQGSVVGNVVLDIP